MNRRMHHEGGDQVSHSDDQREQTSHDASRHGRLTQFEFLPVAEHLKQPEQLEVLLRVDSKCAQHALHERRVSRILITRGSSLAACVTPLNTPSRLLLWVWAFSSS